MPRWFPALMVCLLPAAGRGDVTCAEMQAALHVPPPIDAVSEDPDGPLGCSRKALEMFALNTVAVAEAAPVTDLSQLHGAWLGDLVLPYLLGITVPGQEVLVFAPGDEPDTVRVTQYWMRALTLPHSPLWSDEGQYAGVAAEATLERDDDGRFKVAGFGESLRYGTLRLEDPRSYDLLVKAQLNHFELPFSLGRAGDVLVLDGALRDPTTRDPGGYKRTYTRIAPEAAELALATVLTFELSQARYMDCLAHQITEGQGPLFDALGEGGLPSLEHFVRESVGDAMVTDRQSGQLRSATDEAERKRLREVLRASAEARVAQFSDPDRRAFIARMMEASGGFCPDFF
ncbi:hypothetical protein PVW46_23800 [Mameliella sp. AT18]|uniref:hypothetical protein n=1 Tax=Mameliella sp. AT18 TaxID=3028385 RepID=UPI0008411334|nr:hypothetical protein [Mameliella sp. AT18]MDD9732934.1 hypothetical protein [Mameliella sp. AT18]